MRRVLALVLLSVALTAACSDDGGDAAPAAGPSFPFATVLLDNGDESTLVTVQVAETRDQQAEGLTGRSTLPEDEGMVFVYFDERDDPIQTDDVPIPLSVAFFDASGTIVGIVDTEPCADDPCPDYDPGAEYMGVLQVNRGMFDEWDISEGDHLQLTR